MAARSPAQMRRAARTHRPRRSRATRPATPKKPRPGLAPKPARSEVRLPYADALALSRELLRELGNAGALPVGVESFFAGSLRRKSPAVRDLDLLIVIPARMPFDSQPDPWHAVGGASRLALHAFGPTKAAGVFTYGGQRIPVDIRRVEPGSLGAALEYFTGPKGHNLGMRTKAKKKGWKLNEYGLFNAAGVKIAGDTEASIYDALGHPWKPPEQRGR